MNNLFERNKKGVKIFLETLDFAFPNCIMLEHPLSDIPQHVINHYIVNNSLAFLAACLKREIEKVRPDSWLDLRGNETGLEKRMPLYGA